MLPETNRQLNVLSGIIYPVLLEYRTEGSRWNTSDLSFACDGRGMYLTQIHHMLNSPSLVPSLDQQTVFLQNFSEIKKDLTAVIRGHYSRGSMTEMHKLWFDQKISHLFAGSNIPRMHPEQMPGYLATL